MSIKNETTGLRYKNPLYIRARGMHWKGAISEIDGLVVFDHAVNGIRAAVRVMCAYRDNYGINTIEGIIAKWSFSNAQDIFSYVDNLAQLADIDLATPLKQEQYILLITDMIFRENGRQPYSAEYIKLGVEQGYYQ